MALRPLLEADGWNTFGWQRYMSTGALPPWRLVICFLGRVAPVGYWWDSTAGKDQGCIRANLTEPLRLVREIWSRREKKAEPYVCFFGGSNPQKIMPGYAPYNASKMGLLKLVEQMDAESFDTTIFALGPGYVSTKIHQATLIANWPNERIARGDKGTPIEQIYRCLKWCVEQPKGIIGGRNICASDPWGTELAERLKANPALYKLRRVE